MRQVQEQLARFDKNGDGQVSLDEVEEVSKEAVKKLQEKYYKPACDFVQNHKWTVQGVAGYTLAFYGGNFTHSFLVSNCLKGSEYENIKKSLEELVSWFSWLVAWRVQMKVDAADISMLVGTGLRAHRLFFLMSVPMLVQFLYIGRVPRP